MAAAEAEGANAREVGRQLNSRFLLPYHKAIITSLIPKDADRARSDNGEEEQEAGEEEDEEEQDPNALIVLAKGLGLRKIVSTIMKVYDGPTNLVVLVNATSEEEEGLSEELTTLGVRPPGLRVVTHEMTAKRRQELYMSGGLLSITSRILVVDMLAHKIPTALITGMIVLHAETVSPTSTESFIVRLYRDHNQDGFLKAFSDDPEHFAFGFTPLQTVMGQLHLRRVELWPRFHKVIQKSLGSQKADVVELQQELSRSMLAIQTALHECLEATVSELKRSSAAVDTEEYTVENAIFPVFDTVIRRQLDPVWHRLSPKTKTLVSDLSTLRQLLSYLLSYDPITFLQHCETILAASSGGPSGGAGLGRAERQSPWLMMEAANTIYTEAKRRVYLGSIKAKEQPAPKPKTTADGGDEDEMEVLRQNEGDRFFTNGNGADPAGSERPPWLPEGIDPVLEELPKWKLLRDVLREIEEEIEATEDDQAGWINNTVLIMTNSPFTTSQLRTLLTTAHGSKGIRIHVPELDEDEEPEPDAEKPGQTLLKRSLRNHFMWKKGLGGMSRNSSGNDATANGSPTKDKGKEKATEETTSEALKRKQSFKGPPPGKRRRMRGGAAGGATSGGRPAPGSHGEALRQEADSVAAFMSRAVRQANADLDNPNDAAEDGVVAEGAEGMAPSNEALTETDFDLYFGVLSMQNLVVIRTYRGDEDDKVLQELKPRFVVMYDPMPAYIRRIEVYKQSNPGIGVRLYFMIYAESAEEQRYLSSMRREKESFEKLIREKANMVLPLRPDGRPAEQTSDDRLLRTINSRIAGGQRVATAEPPRVIVDMREFRSTLPSMLHLAGMQVVPCTLQVGDYILTPDICVERKSLSDLVQSLNSGRLYTQCEMMSTYYKYPVLLIEFDQDKSFSLQSVNSARSGPRQLTASTMPQDLDTQQKLVLLTLSFPRLRVIWSSSPYATADIFEDLKSNFAEPDAQKVAAVGLDDENSETGAVTYNNENSYNVNAQDVLRVMPGINTKNMRYMMNQVRNIAELCDLSSEELQELLGAELGRKLYRFINKDAREDGMSTY